MQDIEKALQLMDEGQAETAVHQLDEVFMDKDAEKKFMIAELFEEWGYYEKALEKYEVLREEYPDETQLMIKIAELYIELKEDDRALEMLLAINATDDYYVHALMLQADLYERQGLYEVAEQKLLEAKQYVAAEERYIVDFALAELLFTTGEMKRAIPYYEKVLKVTEELQQISLLERLAESYAYLGEYEQALSFYRRISDKTPEQLFKHGFVAKQANEFQEAIRLWEQLVAIEPEFTSVYSELASLYETEGLYTKAYETAQKGISYDEFNKQLYYLAGKMAYQLSEFDEAKTFLQEAIQLDEDYKDAILLLIDIYKQLDEHTEIIALIDRIKAQQITDPHYEWELARACVAIEDDKRAKEAYQEAYYSFENDATFLKEYGYFLVETGNLKAAKKIFEQYIKFFPNDEEVLAFMERFFF